MNQLKAEIYTGKLLERLFTYYNDYNKKLKIINSQVSKSSAEVLENYIKIEQNCFTQICNLEKIVKIHLKECNNSFKENSENKLEVIRKKTYLLNKKIILSFRAEMKKIRLELNSIRIPAGAKNFKQESAPMLIDIKT